MYIQISTVMIRLVVSYIVTRPREGYKNMRAIHEQKQTKETALR